MGIIVQPVPAALAAHLPALGEDQGWLVSDILPESLLGVVDGLKLYDVIVAIDGQSIDTIRQLRRVLAMSLGLDPVSVEIIRAGKAKIVELNYFPGSENTPRQDARPATGKQSVSISFADRDLSLALASIDGVNYQLEVTYRDAHGQSVKQRLAGTSAHILKQAASLPAPVQHAVRRTLAPTPEAEGTLEPSTPKDAVQPRTQESVRPE
jgi:membrane-associated protease RseP (regulator of RpoE activity)